jgi:hypothetical protein
MPFLKQQIELVVNHLKTGALKDTRFQSGRFEAIAVPVTYVDEGKQITIPAVMDSNYEAQAVSVDDTYPLIIYNKINGKSYATEPGKQYGDGNSVMVERVDVSMVVYGKYPKLKLTLEELEALIISGFPSQLAKALIAPYKLDRVTVQPVSSELNPIAVFQKEYQGVEGFLAPEDILFSIRYVIESSFRKGCFTICDCEGSAI